MNCDRCGHEIPQGARFCIRCGAAVVGMAAAGAAGGAAAGSQATSDSPGPGAKPQLPGAHSGATQPEAPGAETGQSLAGAGPEPSPEAMSGMGSSPPSADASAAIDSPPAETAPPPPPPESAPPSPADVPSTSPAMQSAPPPMSASGPADRAVCPSCGTPTVPGSWFCGTCGATIYDGSGGSPASSNRGCLPRAWKQFAGLGAIAVVVAFFAGFCLVYARDDSSPRSSGSDSDSTAAAASPTGNTSASPASSSTAAASPSAAASASPASTQPATTAAPTASSGSPAPTVQQGGGTTPATQPTTAPVPGATATSTPTATIAPTNTPVPPTATPTTAPITNFAGTWSSAETCANLAAPNRWTVSLTQSGASVSGWIRFHNCPGGGIAYYDVSGTATTAPSITLQGTKNFLQGAGGLGGSAPPSQSFTVTRGGAPAPNLAP